MTNTIKPYSAELSTRVALGAMRGDLMIATSKRQAFEGRTFTFFGGRDAVRAAREGEVEKLHAKIGQLVMEREFFGQSLRPMSVARRRSMIERAPPTMIDLSAMPAALHSS